jgi:hypothetical protein
MKKLLLIALVVVAGATVHAQGLFTYNNNLATRITNGPGSPAPGTPAAGVTVAVYYSGNTNLVTAQDRSGLQINLGAVTNTTANGSIIGGERSVPGLPEGSEVAFQLRAWTGAFATYEDAFAAALGNSSILVGESRVFMVVDLGGPGGTPTPAIFGVNRLNSFTVQPIPEPSSIALGLLGLGAIALFRRRK